MRNRLPPRTWSARQAIWRSLLAVVAAALVVVGGQRSAGFSFFVFNGAPVVWSGAASLRYLSPSTFPPGSVAELHYLEAMGLWNIVPASDFFYSYSPLDQDPPIDNFDGYNDTAAVPADLLDPGVLGVTFLVNNGGQWFDMDMLFADQPAGVGWNFEANPTCEAVDNPLGGAGFSFLLVAVHELGHALGLGHDPIGDESPGTPWFVATMNPRYPSGGTLGQENIVELHTDDRSGVRYLYPHSGPSGPPYVDLALAGFGSSGTLGRAQPLYLYPEVVLPGQEVIAQSVIENLGATNTFLISQGFYLSTDEVIQTSDRYLGSLHWDVAFEDAFEFDVAVEMPPDLPAGEYYLGAIIDDTDALVETYEDNNAVAYCQPLRIAQMDPAIVPLAQRVVTCDQPFVGSKPGVTHPLNMAPITWSLDQAPAGMSIHPSTGVISWLDPVASNFLYAVVIRATNGAGSKTSTFFLGVNPVTPVLADPQDRRATCSPPFSMAAPAAMDPDCMTPIIYWSLEDGPAGLQVHPSTGVLTWANPVPAASPYLVQVAGTNAAGTGLASFLLTVTAGDYNGDGVAGLSDWAAFTACMAGPGQAPAAHCTCGDMDGNGRIDLRDVAGW